jgi:hypothetical protein
MAVITAQSIAETGTTISFTAVNASDTLTNNGNSYLRVKNGNGSNCTVTVTHVNSCDQGFTHDMVATVPATTGDVILGPFSIIRFGNAPVVTYSVQSSVTAALVKLS